MDAEKKTDAELLAALRDRYARRKAEIPPCRVCGAALTLQSWGAGGPAIWACPGYADAADGSLELKPNRTPADNHYARSRFEDFATTAGDPDVIELARRFEEALVKIAQRDSMLRDGR